MGFGYKLISHIPNTLNGSPLLFDILDILYLVNYLQKLVKNCVFALFTPPACSSFTVNVDPHKIVCPKEHSYMDLFLYKHNIEHCPHNGVAKLSIRDVEPF